ncbi:hypothetical protein PNIG_b0524 [Pseudoalteromonas nigrifaciens]|uniref:Uncharacterized protein n=1 Tax=Pseudoalteromonas nigrifaciens TaxID=28109 RepID=A0AAC9UNX3_9GAMM|nr:hypothetical protein PNIG_b0524 [Pseudoalteromonas nigrifaciens]SJN38031.1 hypothetical protein CZ797_08945 [Pseudoalteromonas sp. JB197]
MSAATVACYNKVEFTKLLKKVALYSLSLHLKCKGALHSEQG